MVGVAFYIRDEANLRFFRKDYTNVHNKIEIIKKNYARLEFPAPIASTPLDQESQDKARLTQWVRWMWHGVESPPSAKSQPSDADPQLIYIECEPFDDDYGTINACINLAAGLQVESAMAFLLHDRPHDVWFKPHWKQLETTISPDSGSATLIVDYPSKEDRIAVFLKVAPITGGKLPKPDQIVFDGYIGVRKCE